MNLVYRFVNPLSESKGRVVEGGHGFGGTVNLDYDFAASVGTQHEFADTAAQRHRRVPFMGDYAGGYRAIRALQDNTDLGFAKEQPGTLGEPAPE